MRCSDCSAEVKPVVALDLDGTLAEYHEHFRAFAQEYLDIWLPDGWDGSGDWEEYLGITREQYREAKLAYRQGGGKRLMPVYPYAMQMTHLLRMAGAEVWITTTRPWMRHDSTDPDTREWLRRHRIHYDHLLYDDDKYGKLVTLVDSERILGILDDLPENYWRAQEVMRRGLALLQCRQHNVAARNQHKFAYTTDLRNASDILLARVEWWNEHERYVSA